MEDLISRQAAIDAIPQRIKGLGGESWMKTYRRSGYNDCVDACLNAIRHLPSAQLAITNEEIRFALKQLGAYFSIKIRDKQDGNVPVELLQHVEEIQEYVGNLSSAEPERKHGKWIDNNGLYQCYACKHIWSELWWTSVCPIDRMNKMMHYCPNCGAKMDEEEKEDD